MASPTLTPSSPPSNSGSLTITPELIKKITAKVYALMQADLKTDRERRHPSPQKSRTSGGRHGI